MAIKLRLFISAMLCMAACIAFADEVTKTYQFTSKNWEAVDETGAVVNWISGEDGAGFFKDENTLYVQGVQVTGSKSGANATSPITFKGISKIEFVYNTNETSGKGNISVQIGENTSIKKDVNYSKDETPAGKKGFNAEYTATFEYGTPQDGEVYFAVAVTVNSIYIKSISITYDDGSVSSVATPTFSPAGGNIKNTQNVEISCATEGANIYYTTDGTLPTDDGSEQYISPIHIEETTTINAVAIKDGQHSAVATATFSVVILKDAEFSFDEEEYTANLNDKVFVAPKLNCAEGYDGNIIYSSSNEGVATVDPSTGNITIVGKGTTIVSATAEETANFEAAEASYTLIVNDMEEKGEIEDGVFNFGIGNDYGSGMIRTSSASGIDPIEKKWTAGNVTMITSGRVRWSVGGRLWLYGKYNVSDKVGTCEITVPDGSMITRIDIDIDADNTNGSITVDGEGNGEYSGNMWKGSAKKVTIYNVEGSVAIAKITVTYVQTKVSVEIGAAEYMTFCSKYALDFSDVNAYVVSDVSDDEVTLTEVKTAPANTPVILNAPEGEYKLDIIEYDGIFDVKNYLKVSDGTAKGNGNIFSLALKDNVVAFYLVENNVEIPEGKCYLQTDTSVKSRLELGFGVVDAIERVEANGAEKHDVYYNLNGQRVLNPSNGIYILNNRKVLIK